MSLRPCLTPSSMQYSDIYIHPHTTPTHTTPTHPHPHTTPTNPNTTSTLPYPNPDQPVSKLTLHYPTSLLVTLSHSTIPLPTHHPSLYLLPLTNVHHNRYPSITHIQHHYHLPYHYPTISHPLLTILLFYPPLLKR